MPAIFTSHATVVAMSCTVAGAAVGAVMSCLGMAWIVAHAGEGAR